MLNLGGTMRLGSWEATLKEDSYVAKIYVSTTVHERHRHRWEVNKVYVPVLEEKGLILYLTQCETI